MKRAPSSAATNTVFTLVSNLDSIRDTIPVWDGDGHVLNAIVYERKKIVADEVFEHPGGHVQRMGDIVEIGTDENLTITMGGLPYKLPPGRWMIPEIANAYHSLSTDGPCKIQRFYLGSEERSALAGSGTQFFQRLGDRLVRYTCGMAGAVIEGGGGTIEEAWEVAKSGIFDQFHYRPVMRGTGVFKVSVEGYDHAAVRAVHAKMAECPGADSYSEPLIFSWLVFGRADPLMFTITVTTPREYLCSHELATPATPHSHGRIPSE